MAAFIAAAFLAIATLARRRGRRLRTTDSPQYLEKRAAIVAAGKDSLHFVIDFDRTLTTHFVAPGVRGDSCHGIVEQHRGEELAAKAAALNKVYFPLEIDPSLTLEERIPHMVQWYRSVNTLLQESGITRGDIVRDVARARICLRDGMRELLAFCTAHRVPLTIMSAGIANVITEVLAQHHGPLPHWVRVVSNNMLFSDDNESARIVGWSEPLLHMFNKTGHVLSPDHRADVALRKHVLLIGDGEGDAAMADGLDAEVVLRIGLLNDPATRHRLEDVYAARFDTVLHGDAPCWDLLDLLHALDHQHAEN